MKHSGFNPHARWDRDVPIETGSAFLNQKIEVLAFFKGGKIYPRFFIWNNKKYKIKTITYNWQERQGKETINYFSVSTGAELYQISLNNTSLGWRLDKLIE
ncbi:MAG: hypothetical protein DRP74_07670 [Candidatus Omnitrophota bacterium]|nr:MAG: hypothetical protein DRP74_07670 [Candidatus Omnitrophota bacterium]